MLSQKLRQNPGRVRAIFYAVLVHALVIGLLVIGFRWTTQDSDQKIVQAVVVTDAPPIKSEEINKRAQQEEEARKQAEAEKRKQAELKKKQDEEQQRKDAERKKKELAEKQEKERKRAAEIERKKDETHRQKSAEQSLQEQLAAEEKARQDAARNARAATEVDKYKALIRQRVSRSWSRPMGTAKGLKCVVSVRLTPTGEVLAASVVRSSGDSVFDRSVENAVYKSAPLPLPADPTLFDNFREIEFLFNPEE